MERFACDLIMKRCTDFTLEKCHNNLVKKKKQYSPQNLSLKLDMFILGYNVQRAERQIRVGIFF